MVKGYLLNRCLPLLVFLIASTNFVFAQGTVLCPGTPPSRLSTGLHGRTTFTGPTNLRAGPSTNEAILFEMAEGTEFDILSGPNCGDYTW
ncbi:MAG: hypothetical protein K8L97_30085, partial [Anaerolineae bacterium]|nr:hypothetical protein [Anaerolineae bacterium]